MAGPPSGWGRIYSVSIVYAPEELTGERPGPHFEKSTNPLISREKKQEKGAAICYRLSTRSAKAG
jgi:hypothetical protein